jgi:fluoride exporter
VSLAVVLGIGLCGGVGALARFLLDGAIAGRGGGFPWGTLAVNLSGALLLGLVVGATIGADAYHLGATGVLGSFTTFSTWVLESHRLGEDGRLRLGIVNFVVSLVLGVALAWLGRELGAAL